MLAVAERVGVSENYISEIERGKGKIPSDDVLSKMAEVYMVDELELFDAFGKIPSGLVREMSRNKALKRTLFDIQQSKELTEKEKDELYGEINNLYKNLLNKKPRR
jgi:transcriptional regulator with XRE-family HTH domain